MGKSRVFDRCRGWVFARPTGCRAVSTILLRADLSVLLFRGVARSARQVSHVCAEAATDGQRPCDYQSAIREPRLTNLELLKNSPDRNARARIGRWARPGLLGFGRSTSRFSGSCGISIFLPASFHAHRKAPWRVLPGFDVSIRGTPSLELASSSSCNCELPAQVRFRLRQAYRTRLWLRRTSHFTRPRCFRSCLG